MNHTLHRTTVETSRLLEYFSVKELSMQLDAEPPRWGIILLKELIDNALDACERAGTAPHIRITLSPDGFVVEDNGPGLPASTIERSLDYRVRVSDKAYYVSPTRGQLGNALKCLWAAPYVVNPESPGRVEVSSQGVTHAIAVDVDRIAQEPKITHTVTEATFVKIGTIVQVEARLLLALGSNRRFLQISGGPGAHVCGVQSARPLQAADPRRNPGVPRDNARLDKVVSSRPHLTALV